MPEPKTLHPDSDIHKGAVEDDSVHPDTQRRAQHGSLSGRLEDYWSEAGATGAAPWWFPNMVQCVETRGRRLFVLLHAKCSG